MRGPGDCEAMDDELREGQKVRLRADHLAALMTQGGWTAQRLHLVAGEPSKRSINRWLKQGEGAADQLVVTEWRYVASIADALGVSPIELVDTAHRAAGAEVDRWLRLAAALGPRVYPELLARFGFYVSDISALGGGAFLAPLDEASVPSYRFVRWTHCEEILRDDTCLPRSMAAQALIWAAERGLSVTEAPEIYCQAHLRLGNADDAWHAGLAWVQSANRRNVQVEALWVGERLLASPPPTSEAGQASRLRALLAHSRVLRLVGRPERGLDVITDLSIMAAGGMEPLLRAGILIELARNRSAVGQPPSVALLPIDEALELLGACEPSQEVVDAIVDAYVARYRALQMHGDTDGAIRSHEALDEYARAEPRVRMPRYFRTCAGVAFELGDMESALRGYRNALDVAVAEGNLREILHGQLNVAIAHALLGHTDVALRYFEQTVSTVAAGENGPPDVASVHLNFGEFAWEQGSYGAAKRHLQVAVRQCELAGNYALLSSRSAMLLADTLSAQGDTAEARRWARQAYKYALQCQSPPDEAAALIAMAHANPTDVKAAEGCASAAEARLEGLASRGAYMATARTRRRIAELRHRIAPTRATLAELARLREQAVAAGNAIEVAGLDRILSVDVAAHASA
jgi:tetratricopeptide (TPR) repeat protein